MIFEGVIGLTKDRLFPGSLEYFIGDGVHKYSELPKYGGAEASILSKAYTLVLRNADGKIDPSSIDFPEVPDASPIVKGVVKASTTKAGDNVVKADADGGLSGWKDAISDAVANPSTGLVKNSDGTLGVDFDQMPTTKFEALLKSLKMQIPLEAKLDLYVDKNSVNAADTLDDNRGTTAKPFKTIQAAIDYATQTYAVGSYIININVSQANYTENLTLPTYNRTSGYIQLKATTDSLKPTVINSGAVARTVTVTGGYWVIRNFNISNVATDPNNSVSNFPSAIYCYGGSTTLTLYGTAISQQYDGSAPATAYVSLRTLEVEDGATVNFGAIADYQNSFNCSKGNAQNATVIQVSRKSKVLLNSSNIANDGTNFEVPFTGSVSLIAAVSTGSSLENSGGGTHQVEFTGTITGKKYSITGGSYISIGSNSIPGDTAGTVDNGENGRPQSYCWYSGA